jgi:hypothetical protein
MMDDSEAQRQADARRAGLCATCAHVRIVTNDRGSRFYLCELSLTDSRYSRYPVIPIVACEGYRPAGSPDAS